MSIRFDFSRFLDLLTSQTLVTENGENLRSANERIQTLTEQHQAEVEGGICFPFLFIGLFSYRNSINRLNNIPRKRISFHNKSSKPRQKTNN